MRIKNIDLLLVMAIALINIAWTLRHSHVLAIGVFLAFPLVFLLSGYALLEVLYYGRSPEAVRRLALSFGLSIVMDILGGFLLNMLPMGLNAVSWAIYLGTVTTLLSLIAAFRRGKSSTNGVWPWHIRLNVHKHIIASLFLIIASGMIFLSFLYSRHSALTSKRPGFTDFWMIQSNKDKSGCSVLVGAQSFEFTRMSYHTLVTVNGVQANPWLPVVLTPQKAWIITLPVNSYVNGAAVVEARLYRVDRPALVYRDVHLTLYSRSGRGGLQCSILKR
jgi:hypothetical protein